MSITNYFFKNVLFLGSFIETKLPQIAFIGHSNAGKSTLLNCLIDQPKAKLARVSSKPGHTKTLNYYSISNSLVLCDVMGYGPGSKKEWGQVFEDYIKTPMFFVWVLPSIQPELNNYDDYIHSLLLKHNKNFIICLSQIDRFSLESDYKLKYNELATLANRSNNLCLDIVCTSSKLKNSTRPGIDDLQLLIMAHSKINLRKFENMFYRTKSGILLKNKSY